MRAAAVLSLAMLLAVLQRTDTQYHYEKASKAPNLIPQKHNHHQQQQQQHQHNINAAYNNNAQSVNRLIEPRPNYAQQQQQQQLQQQQQQQQHQQQQHYSTISTQPNQIQYQNPQVQINTNVRQQQQQQQLPLPPQNSLATIPVEIILDQEWEAFKLTYNKQYRNLEEELLRREIYISNRHKVAKLDQAYAKGEMTFKSRINGFADMLQNEFNTLLNGFNVTIELETNPDQRIEQSSTFIPRSNVEFPQFVDWRMVGAVSPVRHQGACAGCWAFASSGALEGQWFRRTGKLNVLSPQNLIDCARPFGNNGCKGGKLSPAYQYVKDNPGIDTEASYPYEARDNQCRFNPANIGAEETGYVEVTRGDEQALEDAVATVGPVSVAIDAGQESFQFYSGGIYNEPNCNNQLSKLNHAVLVVGYGTEGNGEKYWLIKNSYGESWGEGGYIKIAKNRNNHCGVATWASYPLV